MYELLEAQLVQPAVEGEPQGPDLVPSPMDHRAVKGSSAIVSFCFLIVNFGPDGKTIT